MSDPEVADPGLRRPNESFIPNDVVSNILIRLPAKDVLRCRCVCKGWKDLSSTRDFMDLHFQRSLPMILRDTDPVLPRFPNLIFIRNRSIMIDGFWERSSYRRSIIVHQVHQSYQHGPLCFSHNGLIAARGEDDSGSDLVIYNPIYNDVVNISIKPFTGEICGVFFHPVRQEICTLWEIYQTLKGLKCKYKILNLRSNPKWQDINNPCISNHRVQHIPSVLIEKYLYWFVEPSQEYDIDCTINCDIVEYDIVKEEFRVLSCPASIGVLRQDEFDVNLVDIDGVVSVVQVILSTSKIVIDIWTLKDDAEQSWTSSHYFFRADICRNYNHKAGKAIAYRNGDLVLYSSEGSLWVCNLKRRSFWGFGGEHIPRMKFFSHVTSLLSLKSCKSDIRNIEQSIPILAKFDRLMLRRFNH